MVDAWVLIELLTRKSSAEDWTHRPLSLAGARITGVLDLEAATLTRPLHLQDCYVENPFVLRDTQAVFIELPGCHLPSLDADNLHTRGDLALNDQFAATGQVRLPGAHIGGHPDCTGGTFTNKDEVALVGEGLVAGGAMVCGHGFAATGQVRLVDAHIGGHLNCTGGAFTGKDEAAHRPDLPCT